ncbi:MAG: IS110 family transposase [Acidobacteria bacterium]|nr:IS110 family transposase [Acidobacteriota bacterium]MBI3487018.1 IS110 family transposase [Acidobacteriota bacterium]
MTLQSDPTLLGEAGDLRAFQRGRQLTAFVGVSPRRYDSGSSVRGRTRMCQIGGVHVRTVLHMAAVSANRTAIPLGSFYRHLVNQGKPKNTPSAP